MGAWRRVPHRQCLHPVEATQLVHMLDQTEEPILVALSQGCYKPPAPAIAGQLGDA